MQTGGFLARLEQCHSPIGENAGITESHLRPVLAEVPEELQTECWKAVTENIPEGGKLTFAQVKKEARRFLMKKGVESRNSKAAKLAKPDARVTARTSLKKLEAEVGRFVPAERYRPLLNQLLALIDQDISPKPA